MPDTEPPLLLLQRAITDILDADVWFDRIPILNESLGDIEHMTDFLLKKSGLGVCVVIQTPLANIGFPDIPPCYFDECPILISCYAHTELNKVSNEGSGIHPFSTAQVVAALLHQKRIEALADADGNCPQLFAANPTIIPVRDELGKGVVGY